MVEKCGVYEVPNHTILASGVRLQSATGLGENALDPFRICMGSRVLLLTMGNRDGMMHSRSIEAATPTGLNAMAMHFMVDESDPHNVPLGRNGKYGTMRVQPWQFNATVHGHIYAYGLRQILNDAMADKTDDDGNTLPTDQIVAKAEKRLAALYAGELRVRNGSAAEPIDPVEREAFRMAREKITEQFKNLGIWPKKGTDKFQAAVDARRIATHSEPMLAADYIAAWLDRNPKVTAAAKRIVAERAKADESEMV